MLLTPNSTTELFSKLGPEYLTYKDTWIIHGLNVESFQGAFLPINSKVYSFTKQKTGMVVKEMYMIDKGLEMRMNTVGMWNGKVLRES